MKWANTQRSMKPFDFLLNMTPRLLATGGGRAAVLIKAAFVWPEKKEAGEPERR